MLKNTAKPFPSSRRNRRLHRPRAGGVLRSVSGQGAWQGAGEDRQARNRPRLRHSRATTKILLKKTPEGTRTGRRHRALPQGLHRPGALPQIGAGRYLQPRPRRRLARRARRMGSGARRTAANRRLVRAGKPRRQASAPASATAPFCASRRCTTRRPRLFAAASSNCCHAPRAQILGIFREDPRTGGGRIVAGRQEATRKGVHRFGADSGGPATAISSASKRCARDRLGLPVAKVRERLGSIDSEKAMSLIAINIHGIPDMFRPETIAASEAAKPARWKPRAFVARTGARCRSSPSTRPTPRTTTTPSTPSRLRSRQSRRLHRHRRHRRRRRLVRPGIAARPRGAGARQFGLFPRPRRADAAGAHLQRSLLAAPGEDRPALAVRMRHRRGRPQARPRIPSRHDALGGEALLCAGAGARSTARPTRRQRPLLDAGVAAAVGAPTRR